MAGTEDRASREQEARLDQLSAEPYLPVSAHRVPSVPASKVQKHSSVPLVSNLVAQAVRARPAVGSLPVGQTIRVEHSDLREITCYSASTE